MGKTDKNKKGIAPAAIPTRRHSTKKPAEVQSEAKKHDGRSKGEKHDKQVKTGAKTVKKPKLKLTVKDKEIKDKELKDKDNDKKNLQQAASNTDRKNKKTAETEEKAVNRPSALKKPQSTRQIKRDLTEDLEKAAGGDKRTSLESIKKKLDVLKKWRRKRGVTQVTRTLKIQ